MLRSLLWIEFRSTWWWWLLALVPLAVVRQFPGEETTRLSLTCLEPIAAGLGIASGMRDRQGVRLALSRHGGTWRILLAKLIVPAVMMPAIYLFGRAIFHEATANEVAIVPRSYWDMSDLGSGPMVLAPLFLAGLASGLRQARWWGSRLAPFAVLWTMNALFPMLMPWNYQLFLMDTASWMSTWYHLMVIEAALFSSFLLWSCLASLREAGGEDGPRNRMSVAWTVALAGMGLAMAPWLSITQGWLAMLHSDQAFDRLVVPDTPLRHLDAWYAQSLMDLGWTSSPGRSLPNGDRIEFISGTAQAYGPRHRSVEDPLVTVSGTGANDGRMRLAEAWKRLHLSPAIVVGHWRSLSIGAGSSGRCVQGVALADVRKWPWFVPDAEDPRTVRPLAGGAPVRQFQIDTWSGPEPVIRPLNNSDPPFLLVTNTRIVGIWEDRMTWTDLQGHAVSLPHPFAPGVQAAVYSEDGRVPGEVVDFYEWRDSQWSEPHWQIDRIASDGKVIQRMDLPTAEGSPAVRGLALLGSPAIAVVGFALNLGLPWAQPLALPWVATGGAIAIVLTAWLAARRGLTRGSRWGWILAAACGGISVPIAFLAVWHPAPRRPCPSCGRQRWADDQTCPECASGWGTPPTDERTIKDEVQVELVT